MTNILWIYGSKIVLKVIRLNVCKNLYIVNEQFFFYYIFFLLCVIIPNDVILHDQFFLFFFLFFNQIKYEQQFNEKFKEF